MQSEPPPQRRRAAIVGLGRAASLTLAALADRPDVVVVAGVDPRGPAAAARLPEGVPVLSTLDGMPEADLVVVATPTPTHVDVCTAVLERCPGLSLLLCEKPVALVADDVERLWAAARARDVDLRALLHYAFAPEALWLAERLSDLAEIVSVESRFEDPYRDVLAERLATLSSSWADSGINALSVLARLVALEDASPRDGGGPTSMEATVRFRSARTAGTGVVRTSWLVPEASKSTRLGLADGTIVDLDHDRGTATVGGRELYRSAAPDLKLERYRLMLSAHLDDDATVFAHEEVVLLHRLLAWGGG
jgi:predicted dehydrogenase